MVSVSPSPQEATAKAAASITSSGTVQSQFPVHACEPNILISACQRIDMRAMLGPVAHGVCHYIYIPHRLRLANPA